MPLGTKVKVHISTFSVHTCWKINKQICVKLSCRIISLNPKHELANNSTLPSLYPSIYLWAVGSPLSSSIYSLFLSHNPQKPQNVDFPHTNHFCIFQVPERVFRFRLLVHHGLSPPNSDLIAHPSQWQDAGEAWPAPRQGCLKQEVLQKHYTCYEFYYP